MSDYNKETLPELFDELISLKGAARDQRLTDIRANWPDIAAELERLLKAAPSEAGLPESLPGSLVTHALQPEANDLPEEIAGYRVKSLLGVGGMGAVYLGHREDLGQHVALKVAHRADPARPGREILNHEARILAGLNHPHIARIIDWEMLPDGRQLIVTDYINGRNILQYCSDQRLGIEGRIRLFLQVVDALAHAHANLVIHRDIKPGNILVDDSGSVRLIDFGIARNLEEAGDYAQTVNPPATPEYASPEQLAGKSLTVLSDVYSLGAVLFELLTGCRPHTREQKRRIGPDDPPPRASSTVRSQAATPPGLPEPRALARRLREDPDTILAKALAHDPDERYRNAAAFGDDLQRFLEHRPITAQRPGIRYVLGKAVRRNRAAAVASAAAVLALIAGISFGGVQWQRAVAEREQAIESRDRLSNYSMFLTRLMEQLDAFAGGDPHLTMEGFVDQALERLRTTDRIDIESRAWFSNNLGSIYGSWGEYDRALEALDIGLNYAYQSETPQDDVSLITEKALVLGSAWRYEQVIATAREAIALARARDDTDWRTPYARMALAEGYFRAGRPLQAYSEMQKVIDNPDRPQTAKAFAAYIAAKSMLTVHRYEEARRMLGLARPVYREEYGEESAQFVDANALTFQLDTRESPGEQRQETIDELLASFPVAYPEDHARVGHLRSYIAEYHFLRGNLDGALTFQRRALDMLAANQAVAFTEIMPVRFDLVRYLIHAGRPGEAAAVLQDIDPDPDLPVAASLRAEQRILEAWLAVIEGSPSAAATALDEAEELLADSPYDHLQAELDHRRAQLAAARENWRACAQRAAGAAQLARETLPAAWSLPEVYATLGERCRSRLESADTGSASRSALPDLFRNSPWAADLHFIRDAI